MSIKKLVTIEIFFGFFIDCVMLVNFPLLRESQRLYNSVHPLTNVIGESISSITMYNIVNQLGKHDNCCGSVVNNLKGRKIFTDQINRNSIGIIRAWYGWNCSAKENLRCRKSAVNETI